MKDWKERQERARGDAKADERMIISQGELAAATGFARSTIAAWVADGTLPTVEINGRRYLRRDLVWGWFDERTNPGKGPKKVPDDK
jgi:predicted DNA-binding transcriptional regulator AlpA